MDRRIILLGTTAAFLLLVVALAFLERPPVGVAESESDRTSPEAPEESTLRGTAAPLSRLQSVRSSSERRSAEPVLVEDQRDSGPGSQITGIVLDSFGVPVSDAQVSVGYRRAAGFNILDLAYANEEVDVGKAATDGEGQFRVSVPEAWPLRVLVEAEGYAKGVRNHVFAGEHLLFQLEPGAVLQGRIVRQKDGAPVAGVELRGWSSKTRVTLFRTETDPGGNYRIQDLPAGVLTVEVTPSRLASPAWATMELFVGQIMIRDFELEEGVAVTGRVTDSTTGRPVEGAEVGMGWTFAQSVRTDALGHYELPGFGGPGVYGIYVRAEGYVGTEHEFPYTAMPTEPTVLDFQLYPGRKARGRVLGPDGEPLAGVYAAAVVADRADWKSTRSDGEGRFEIDGVFPSPNQVLFLRKRGFGSLVYDFPDVEGQGSVRAAR